MKLEKILKAAATFEAQLKYPSTIVCGTAMAMADIPGFIPADLDVVIDPRDFHRLFPENTEYVSNERNTFTTSDNTASRDAAVSETKRTRSPTFILVFSSIVSD